MLALINRLLDWFRSLFWKEEMELTLVGLQYSGKTTFVNVIALPLLSFSPAWTPWAWPLGLVTPGTDGLRDSSRCVRTLMRDKPRHEPSLSTVFARPGGEEPWCRTRLSWSDSEWQRVIFSDESRFSLGGDAQRIRVWRHRVQHRDERFGVTRPGGLVSFYLHPYRTICRNCSGQFSEDMIPTVGFNMRKVTKGNVTIKIWDIGGQPRFRSMWERYCRGVNAIVYMVDAADRDKIEPSRNELHNLLDKPQLQGIPVLVLGNKRDLPNALDEKQLIEKMNLAAIQDREICCYSVSCKEKDNIGESDPHRGVIYTHSSEPTCNRSVS
ncbi:hypothetical protein NFI96_022088, partial [Prochilodus magdalenae]